jgi:hypothetical protein
VSEIKKIDINITNTNSLIKNGQWKISELSREKNKAIVSVQEEKKEAQHIAKLLLSAIEQKDLLVDDKSYYDIMNLMLKDSNIKSTIVKQYANVINKLVNHYLQVMGLFIELKFDDDLNNISVKLQQRNLLSYDSLSEGEKTRVNLSILFAFRKIQESKNIGSCNLIVFDEILDSSMDKSGLDSVVGILEEFSDKHIFIVSHRDGIDDICDRKIIVNKRNNYSVITEII